MPHNQAGSASPKQLQAHIMHLQAEGTNTFRGLTNASSTRSAFFGKTMGELELQRDLLSVQSPISGSTMTAPNTAQHGAMKDPITGTTLDLSHGRAKIVSPVIRQQQVHARTFYLRRDVDIQIAQLRKTNKVSRYTNEKIGTAGQATGLDKALLDGGKLRRQKQAQQQQLGQQHEQSREQ